jgi:hypothetical protein
MMPGGEESRRYIAVIQFKSDTTRQRIAMDAPKLISLFDRFSRGEKEVAFRSKDGLLFGILFRSSVPGGVMEHEFQQSDATQNGDSLLIFEAGTPASAVRCAGPFAWLQHH